jgi:hypothetical protein
MTLSGLLHSTGYACLIAVLVLFLRKYVYGFSERTLKDVLPFLRRLVLEDVLNLLHPEVEDHIRSTLPPAQFKRIQWKRIRLAVQYLGDLAENAKVFQAWGKHERSLSVKFPDAERKRASLELITACVQSRICVFRVIAMLHWWLVRMAFLPFLSPPSFRKLQQRGSFDVFVFYEQVKKAAGELSQPYGDAFYQELLKSL